MKIVMRFALMQIKGCSKQRVSRLLFNADGLSAYYEIPAQPRLSRRPFRLI